MTPFCVKPLDFFLQCKSTQYSAYFFMILFFAQGGKGAKDMQTRVNAFLTALRSGKISDTVRERMFRLCVDKVSVESLSLI